MLINALEYVTIRPSTSSPSNVINEKFEATNNEVLKELISNKPNKTPHSTHNNSRRSSVSSMVTGVFEATRCKSVYMPKN